MSDATDITDPPGGGVTLTEMLGPRARAFFIVAGAAVIALPVWDLGPGLWPPSAALPVFLVIVAGACVVGMGFLLAGLVGDSTVLTADDGWITLSRRNLFRHERRAVAPAEIARIGTRRHDWDSRPATFSVEVVLTSGLTLGSGEFTGPTGARMLARRFAVAAGRADLFPG